MSTQEYIESGILELFVYGKLNDSENEEVVKMAKQHTEIQTEIIEISKYTSCDLLQILFGSRLGFCRKGIKVSIIYRGQASILQQNQNPHVL